MKCLSERRRKPVPETERTPSTRIPVSRGSVILLASLALLLTNISLASAAEENKPSEPAGVFRITSLQEVIADVRHLTLLQLGEEAVKQFESAQEKFWGKDSGGLDLTRPAGFYSFREPIDMGGLVLPIANETRFIEWIKSKYEIVTLEKDGSYTIPTQGTGLSFTPYSFRIANEYVYFCQESIDRKRLPDPVKLLASERKGVISGYVRLDRLPNENKKLNVDSMVSMLDSVPNSFGPFPGLPELQQKLRTQVVHDLSGLVDMAMKDGERIELEIGLDRKTNDVFTEMQLTGKPKSKLAESIAALGRENSRFADMPADAALKTRLHLHLTEKLTDAVRPTLDETLRRVLQNASAETARKQVENLVEALDATLKSGELDAGFCLLGPDKQKYTLVAGLKLKEGDKVEAALRELIKKLPETDRDKFAFDVQRIDKESIHRADVQHDFDEKSQRLFGSHPVYFSIRSDAAWVAAGPRAAEAIKQALAAKAAPGPVLSFETSVSRLSPLLEHERGKKSEELEELARKLFGKVKGSDRFQFTIEGGNALRVRLATNIGVLNYFEKANSRSVEMKKPLP